MRKKNNNYKNPNEDFSMFSLIIWPKKIAQKYSQIWQEQRFFFFFFFLNLDGWFSPVHVISLDSTQPLKTLEKMSFIDY